MVALTAPGGGILDHSMPLHDAVVKIEMPASAPQIRGRDDSHTSHSKHAKEPAICPTDDDVLVPRKKTSGKNRQSTEYIIKSGIAGGIAGCAAKTVVGPLDRVKILFQASNPQFAKYTGSTFGVVTAMRDIWNSTGYKGLFRGHSATLLRVFPYAGIKFLAYEQVRAIMIKNNSQETPARRFLSGSISGCISVFFTYPLEVIRVRLAFETKTSAKTSYSDICKRIYFEQPPLRPRDPMPSMAQLAVDSLKPPAAIRATVAAGSEAAAEAVNVMPRGGIINFYRGFTPTLWGMLPYAGASFLTHDMVGDLLRLPRYAAQTTIPGTGSEKKPAQLTSWAQLIAGGVAGFVSQTVSYPFEVIRRRMQVGGAVGDGHRQSMGEVARLIWSERSFRGFFVGLGIGYFKVIPMAATSFYVYERGKWYLGI